MIDRSSHTGDNYTQKGSSRGDKIDALQVIEPETLATENRGEEKRKRNMENTKTPSNLVSS